MAQDHYAALFTKLSEEGFDSREFVRLAGSPSLVPEGM